MIIILLLILISFSIHASFFQFVSSDVTSSTNSSNNNSKHQRKEEDCRFTSIALQCVTGARTRKRNNFNTLINTAAKTRIENIFFIRIPRKILRSDRRRILRNHFRMSSQDIVAAVGFRIFADEPSIGREFRESLLIDPRRRARDSGTEISVRLAIRVSNGIARTARILFDVAQIRVAHRLVQNLRRFRKQSRKREVDGALDVLKRALVRLVKELAWILIRARVLLHAVDSEERAALQLELVVAPVALVAERVEEFQSSVSVELKERRRGEGRRVDVDQRRVRLGDAEGDEQPVDRDVVRAVVVNHGRGRIAHQISGGRFERDADLGHHVSDDFGGVEADALPVRVGRVGEVVEDEVLVVHEEQPVEHRARDLLQQRHRARRAVAQFARDKVLCDDDAGRRLRPAELRRVEKAAEEIEVRLGEDRLSEAVRSRVPAVDFVDVEERSWPRVPVTEHEI